MKSIRQVMKEIIPDMTFLGERVCKGCHQTIKRYETVLIGGPNKGEKTVVEYGCLCEDRALAEQEQEKRKQMEIEKVKEHFNAYSLINHKLKRATLENYQPMNQSQEIAKKAVEKYIRIFDLDNPINLLFTGGFGVGKSHLAKVITDGVMAKQHHSLFISVPKLLRKIRSTYDKDAKVSEGEILTVLETVDLLVLDDIGAERQNDWSEERLFDIIDSRQGMHTIYTSNYNGRDLLQLLDERNFSRVVNEDTKIIEITGDNYRLMDLNT